MLWFTALKVFFGGIFGPIFKVLGKLLSDWRVVAVLAIGFFVAMTYYQFKAVTHKLEVKAQQYDAAVKDNETLKGNVTVLTETNTQNGVVIDQLKKDKQQALDAVSALSAGINKNNKLLTDVQTRINAIKTPPTPLTPYLVEAIDGVQKQRGDAK